MEPFGSLVWLTVPVARHTTHSRPKAKRNKNNKIQHAAKFPRYIMLQTNFECSVAAWPRLSGDATNGKEKKGRFRVGPTENQKFECTRKMHESRELWSIHLCSTLTATDTATFGHFLIFSCLRSSPQHRSRLLPFICVFLFARSTEKLVIGVCSCWCRDSATQLM